MRVDISIPTGMRVSEQAAQWLKSNYHEILSGDGPPNFQSLHHYNSATDCSTSPKFGTVFDDRLNKMRAENLCGVQIPLGPVPRSKCYEEVTS